MRKGNTNNPTGIERTKSSLIRNNSSPPAPQSPMKAELKELLKEMMRVQSGIKKNEPYRRPKSLSQFSFDEIKTADPAQRDPSDDEKEDKSSSNDTKRHSTDDEKKKKI